jgi:uncharacterized protein
MTRNGIKVLLGVLSLFLAVSLSAGIFLAQIVLHPGRRPIMQRDAMRSIVAAQFSVKVDEVSIPASNGATLRGWYVHPMEANGASVILLHGMADNREGVAGYARMFLHHGYSVLLPDSRAHCESGGEIATYVVLERDDVRRWAEWLRPQTEGCEYLFGESMGAAIALQAAAVVPSFCAVAVETPFATFREIAYDRISQQTGLGPWFAHSIGRPVLEFALLYGRIRYGVNLADANPERAIAQSHIPTLLICGTADSNIPMRHSLRLEEAGRAHSELWVVQGAEHTGAVSVNPAAFEAKVLGWFQEHAI